MEKAIKTIGKIFPSNKFYYDDIEKLFNLFNDELGECIIETDEYKNITNLTDLKKLKPISMKIYSHKDDYIVLYLDEDYTNISVNDTTLNRGFLSNIDEILNTTIKKTNFLYILMNSYIVPPIAGISLAAYFILNNTKEYIGFAVFVYMVPFITSFFIKNKNIFILDKQRSSHSYYKENKEWLIPFTTTIIGVLIGNYFSN